MAFRDAIGFRPREKPVLPVELLAAPDCALFLWCIWPLQPYWQDVIAACIDRQLRNAGIGA